MTLAEKLRELAIGVAWKRPFFLPALSQARFVECKDVRTLAVRQDGTVFFNPDCVNSLTDEQKAGVVFHEIMHPLSRHIARRGERDQILWNIAADMAINHFLAEIDVRLPEWVVMPPKGMESYNSETLYDLIKDDPKWQELAAQIRANQCRVGAGCGVEEGGTPIDWEGVAAQARSLAPGDKLGQALARVLLGRPAGIRWEALLRGVCSRALSEHGRDEQTWSRRSRRSPPGLVLPGWRSVRARVAIVVDTSGSVSDEMLTRAIDQIQAIAKAVSSVRIFLVTHDFDVQWSGWLQGSNREIVASRFRGRGGTSFADAYCRVTEEKLTFDALVHLTDGEVGNWPRTPKNVRRLVAAMYGADPKNPKFTPPPEGATVIAVDV